jgi:hypothetical protein
MAAASMIVFAKIPSIAAGSNGRFLYENFVYFGETSIHIGVPVLALNCPHPARASG